MAELPRNELLGAAEGAQAMTVMYLDDFAVGQTFGSGRLVLDKEQIKRFASDFDPQPFHLDEKAAQETMFRGLAASCAVPDCDGASSFLSRQEEDALWQRFFMAAPARRRVFVPSSKGRKRAPGPWPPGTA